jgi:hypothetical protein
MQTAQTQDARRWYWQQAENDSRPQVRTSPPWPDITHGQPLLRCAQHRPARDQVLAFSPLSLTRRSGVGVAGPQHAATARSSSPASPARSYDSSSYTGELLYSSSPSLVETVRDLLSGCALGSDMRQPLLMVCTSISAARDRVQAFSRSATPSLTRSDTALARGCAASSSQQLPAASTVSLLCGTGARHGVQV